MKFPELAITKEVSLEVFGTGEVIFETFEVGDIIRIIEVTEDSSNTIFFSKNTGGYSHWLPVGLIDFVDPKELMILVLKL